MKEAIAFDLYGTLVDYGSLRERLASLAPQAPSFIDVWRTKQLTYAFLATMMDRYVDFDEITARSLDYVAAQLRVELDGAARTELVDAWSHLPPHPDVPAALVALRERGVKLAVLSNGTPPALARTLAAAKLSDLFDGVLSVDAVRAYKPRREVYELAVTFFGREPADIGFVSSNGWDAAGAAAFGFDVSWCNRAGLPAETFGPAPARTLRHLGELLQT